MSEEPIVPIPSEEPRFCPACGTRVAARAKTCLMCGASLDAEPEPPAAAEEAPRHTPRWLFWLGTVALALVLLIVIGFLVRPLIFPSAPTPTPTPARPTRTPTPTVVPSPTDTPTATPTPTPVPPRAHQVRQGETLITIAQQYDTTVEEILALNPGINPQLLQTGQVLLIPPVLSPEASPVEPGEPTGTPGGFIIHVVAPGETLLSIAERYGVTVALIRAANPELPAGSDVIRVNQSLVIPIGTPTPTLVPTVDANATPTPLPPYAPPALLSPPDGAVFSGPGAVIVLEWASVDILGPGEWYALHVARAGAEPIVVRTRTTAYRVPAELYPPPGAVSREVRWRVQIVRQVRGGDTYEVVSLPEPVRTFRWLEVAPTPTVTPRP